MSRLISFAVLATLLGCSTGDGPSDTPAGLTTLQIEDLTVGTGPAVVAGDTIFVNYVGTFLDGRQFDSSRGQPIAFQIGVGRVIAGWDQGLIGMRVGGRRRLTIPSSLAYGSAGFPPIIPPNTPLRFEIDLVAIAGK
jgi:FKBP-type peptidyl-prolyl cis-trans isomerase